VGGAHLGRRLRLQRDVAKAGSRLARGYDLEGAERVRVGRPSLAGHGGRPSPRVNVRIPEET
jgi:hypothetical protein